MGVVQAGEETCSGRRTIDAAVGIGKLHAFLSQAINIRGLDDFLSIAPEETCTEVIGVDEDDVGFVGIWGGGTGGKGSDEGRKGSE